MLIKIREEKVAQGEEIASAKSLLQTMQLVYLRNRNCMVGTRGARGKVVQNICKELGMGWQNRLLQARVKCGNYKCNKKQVVYVINGF